MKSQTVDVLGLCKDESNTKRLVRNLTARHAEQAIVLSGLFQNWVEEQIKMFVESSITSTLISDDVANASKVEQSSEHAKASNSIAPALADKAVTDDGLASGLAGLTFGGIPIGVKAKQQKKRMKPNLVNEKPVHNSVLGNINSQTNEATDIRLEMKYAAVPIMLNKLAAATNPTVSTDEACKVVPAPKVEKTEPTCTGSSCAQCRASEDLPAVLRLATIYSTLVNYQHISLLKALSTMHLLTCMDPHRCSDCFVQVCSQESASGKRHSLTAGALLINATSMRAFARNILEKCIYVISNCGTAIASEIMESAIVRSWAPELAVKMKDILSMNASASVPGLDLQSTTTNFKLPETFLKPFREDYDSKNEYKTQAELAIFYERERAYDELSNLYYRFQVINRSDLDGSALATFLRTDLVRTGTAVLMLRDCNYLWFAELFMGLLLFHGCSTSTSLPLTPIVTDRAEAFMGPSAHQSVTVHTADASPSRKGSTPSPGTKGGGLSLGFGGASASGAPASGAGEYSANFPSLSALKNFPLDVSKHSKLEERLGVGGEVKQVLFSQTPTSSTFRSTSSTSTGSAGQASGSGGGYKGKNPRKPVAPYHQQQSPQPHATTASDAYEGPSAHFGGSQQFFFRFIVMMNNHRFNQSLLTCLLAEVSSLLRNETFDAASSVNFEMGSPAKGKGISMFLPTDKSATTARQESNRDFFISPEDYALKVTKLKLLGRFLGLLHFYHRWAETSTVLDVGPVQKLALSLAEKRSVLRESLPVLTVLQQSRRLHTLSLSVPWACEFLKMMTFDAACVGLGARADPQSTRARDRCSELVPYFDVLAYLHELQFSECLQPLGSKLSSNRLFVAMEIQGFWLTMPAPVKGAVQKQSSVAPASVPGSTADAGEQSSADDEQDMALDDQHLAFTAQFLRHVTPYLEPLYLAWKKRRAEQAQLMSPKHHSVMQVKKKRQTPSVVTCESIAFTQSLVNAPGLPEPPVATAFVHGAVGNISMAISKPVELSVVLPPPAATPTKARRSMSSGSATCDTPPPRTAKSPRKLSSAALTAMNKLDNSNGALIKSPTKSSASRIRNSSFEAISPGGMQVPSSPRHTPSQFIDRPAPGSAANSITTSGRSSPATTLYSKSRQRSLSDLNNPLSLRLSGVSPSPLKSASPGLHGTPVRLGEFGLIGNDSSDVLERLEIAFWHDHTSLQEMSNFLLSQTSQACWHHIKELVADGVRELVGSIASLKSERDSHRYEDLLENYMKRVHADLVKDGEQFIEDYYASFIEKTLPQMCKLYPINPRVVKMAIFFMNRHFRVQKETFCAHLKGYGYRKLRQLCEASNKRKGLTASDGALGAGVTDGAGTSTSSQGQPDVLAARRLCCDTQLPTTMNALLRFITFTSVGGEVIKADLWSGKCSCEFLRDSLFFASGGGTTEVASVSTVSLRNNMSLLLSLLTEVSSQLCTLAASHCMRLTAAAATEGMPAAASLTLIFSPAEELVLATGVRLDLNTALHNVLSVYQAAVTGISAAVHDDRLLLSATRRAELQGKVAADLAKFTTSIVPYLLYLDVVYAALQCSGSTSGSSVPALDCLTRYSTQFAPRQDGIEVPGATTLPALRPLPSDLLHHMMTENVLSLEIISRTLGLIARAKTAAYYENCKGLLGIKECVSKALLAVVGRIIIRNQDVLGIDMSVLDDDGWYQDSSIRLLVKSHLSENLSTLISTLLVSLQTP